MDLKDRPRKIDVEKLSMAEADNLSNQIGDKVRGICDEAAAKVNAILNIYGMSAKIAIQFDTLPKQMKNVEGSPKKRGRKPKTDNLKSTQPSTKRN